FGAAYAKRDPLGHQRVLPVDPTPHPLSQVLPATPAEWEQGRLYRAAILGPAVAAVGWPRESSLRSVTAVRDVQGRVLREESAGGKARSWEYDPNGYEITSTDFEGRTTRYEYRSWNHLVRVERPGKRVTEMEYT